jgi:hypothetical protein
MAETEKPKATATATAKVEGAGTEKEVSQEDQAALERQTSQDFEVGSEEALDPKAVAAFEAREEAVDKLIAENAARVQ